MQHSWCEEYLRLWFNYRLCSGKTFGIWEGLPVIQILPSYITAYMHNAVCIYSDYSWSGICITFTKSIICRLTVGIGVMWSTFILFVIDYPGVSLSIFESHWIWRNNDIDTAGRENTRPVVRHENAMLSYDVIINSLYCINVAIWYMNSDD